MAPQEAQPEPSAPDPTTFRNRGKLIAFLDVLAGMPSARTVGFVEPGNAWLEGRFGRDERTIERWIKRLVALGAIAVEIISGVRRRITILMSVQRLRELLLPGVRAVAEMVARGPASARRSSSRRDDVGVNVGVNVGGLPSKACSGEDNKHRPAAPAVASSPTAPSEPANPGLVAAIAALGIPHATALTLSTSAPVEVIREAGRLLLQRRQAGKVRNPAGFLTDAIRKRWKAEAPRSEAQESRGGVPAPRPVRSAPQPAFEPATAASLDRLPEGMRQRLLQRAGGLA